jgi:hypothetical protein
MTPEPECDPDRGLAGEQLEPQAEVDPGPDIGRCILLIYDQHVSLMLLVEIGMLLHVSTSRTPPSSTRRKPRWSMA